MRPVRCALSRALTFTVNGGRSDGPAVSLPDHSGLVITGTGRAACRRRTCASPLAALCEVEAPAVRCAAPTGGSPAPLSLPFVVAESVRIASAARCSVSDRRTPVARAAQHHAVGREARDLLVGGLRRHAQPVDQRPDTRDYCWVVALDRDEVRHRPAGGALPPPPVSPAPGHRAARSRRACRVQGVTMFSAHAAGGCGRRRKARRLRAELVGACVERVVRSPRARAHEGMMLVVLGRKLGGCGTRRPTAGSSQGSSSDNSRSSGSPSRQATVARPAVRRGSAPPAGCRACQQVPQETRCLG